LAWIWIYLDILLLTETESTANERAPHFELDGLQLFLSGRIFFGWKDACIVKRARLIRMLQEIAGQSVSLSQLRGRETNTDLNL